MPWLYNEDAALKLKLQGLTVTDANAPSGRPVPVRYRLPEDELATLSYPVIIIEHDGPPKPDPSREHRGYIQIPYAPEGQPEWFADGSNFDPSAGPYSSFFPIPYNLNYKVSVFTRKFSQHLEPLMAALAQYQRLPYHFGFLDVPQDGTKRSMFLGINPVLEYGKDQDNKRLFRATYMVQVVSELIPELMINGQYGALATTLNLDLGCYQDVTDLTTEEVAASVSYVSAGAALGWNVLSPSSYSNVYSDTYV